VIQRAGERALKAGTTLKKVLGMAAQIREKSEVPLLLFTYLNPVMRYGLDNLARDAAACGVDGCLLTDASVEEAHEYVAAMHRHGLDTVFLAAPTSTPRRLKLVAEYSTGFAYLVSRTGVTGERDSLSDAVAPLVQSMRSISNLPLAVGFGISRPEHVAQLAPLVEAVVVGSAFVRVIERNMDSASLEIQLESFVRELKHGFGAQA
jgi:tryptophan synthase alpha chain